VCIGGDIFLRTGLGSDIIFVHTNDVISSMAITVLMLNLMCVIVVVVVAN